MANKKISEGVGKKIVEALKKQSEIEINTKPENEDYQEDEALDLSALDDENENSEEYTEKESDSNNFSDYASPVEDFSGMGQASEEETPSTFDTQAYNSAPQNSFQGFAPQQGVDSLVNELDNFEIPNNIAVLKKLITQLPKGVTRHTGAQIIKQTMEALGISMKSVLQEAQAVQDNLSNTAKECQSTIQEYKKQIIVLEKQVQSNQKQYAALNELISLFIQTGV